MRRIASECKSTQLLIKPANKHSSSLNPTYIGCYNPIECSDFATKLEPYKDLNDCFKLASDKGFSFVGLNEINGRCWATNSFSRQTK